MSLEETVHDAQIKILRELIFLPTAHFAALQRATGLDSDHVKFHIKRLVALGYVIKTADGYMLSIKGKEYANKLDTDAGVIERQPKVAVLLVVERQHHNEKQYLLQQRLSIHIMVFGVRQQAKYAGRSPLLRQQHVNSLRKRDCMEPSCTVGSITSGFATAKQMRLLRINYFI